MSQNPMNRIPNDSPRPDLDALFAAARKDSALFSQSEIESLIADHSMQVMNTGSKLSFFERLTTGTRMTITGSIIGFGLAGFVAYNALLSGELTNKASSPKPSISLKEEVSPLGPGSIKSMESMSSIDPVKEVTPAIPVSAVTTPTTPIPPTPPVNDSLFAHPMQVEGVRMVVLKPEERQKLGIREKGNGELEYFVGEGKEGKMGITLLPKNGIKMAMDVRSADIANLTVPKFGPTLVTDAQGRKRLFSFSEDSSGPGFHRMTSIHLAQDSGMNPFQDFVNEQKQVEINVNVEGDGESRPAKTPAKIRKHSSYEYKIENGKLPKISVNGQEMDMGDFKFRIDSAVNDPNMVKKLVMNKHLKVALDSDNFDAMKFNFNIDMSNSDSLLKSLPKNGRKMQFRREVIMSDDSITPNAAEINKLVQKAMKQAMQGLDSAGIELDIAHDALNDAHAKMHIDMRNMMKHLHEMAEERFTKINSLVPVFVEAPGSPINKGFIFWYEPTKEFLNTLPEHPGYKLMNGNQTIDINPDASSSLKTPTAAIANGAILHAMIYPNPAGSSTTLHYTLSEPRTISVAVHDLLGRQLSEVATPQSHTAGEIDQSIRLNGLQDGVYLLVITSDKGEKSIQRLVVERGN